MLSITENLEYKISDKILKKLFFMNTRSKRYNYDACFVAPMYINEEICIQVIEDLKVHVVCSINMIFCII